MYILYKIFLMLILLNGSQSFDETSRPVSTLDVLYIVPDELDAVYNLNEKAMLGNGFTNGWILPSETALTLNFYLYYDGIDERRLTSFFLSSTSLAKSSELKLQQQANTSVTRPKEASAQKLKSSMHQTPKALLYMYFTDNDHDCMESKNHQPLEIVEKISTNMYKAQLRLITLPYSSRPLYICMQQFDADDDIHDTRRYFSHQGTDYWISIITTKDFLPLWARIILFVILLTLSGLFSGLNLGLMSLDLSELEILKKIGTPKEQSFASKIYPLRKRGNFLLCTILLGNVLVNSTSTLILGDMLSGVYAALGSTLLIVIFGEIIPQAACSKHGLAVGAYTRYITYFFMLITCPLSYPISLILDKVLGKEIAAVYNREKIRELMKTVKGIDKEELRMISGALDFNKRKVKEIMTELKDVFMLELSDKLNFETIAKISQNGFSRIPVYAEARENIVGLLHVKDFTLLDPDDNMPVQAILQFYNHKIIWCDADKPIDQMFEEFSKGETHLAFVQDTVSTPNSDPYITCIGIVTLEDIIEALVQTEIYDEFDRKDQIIKEEQNGAEVQSISTNGETNHLVVDSKSKIESPKSKIKSKVNILDLTPIATESSSSIALMNSGTTNANTTTSNLNSKSLSRQKSQGGNSSAIKSKSGATPYLETQMSTSHDLTFFIQQQKDSGQHALISPQVRFVMFQFLSTTVKPFTSEFLTKNVLELIFKKVSIKESRRESKVSPEYLYHYGKGCNYFILILSGEAVIEVGKEKLEFPAGPFAYFGTNALLCGAETSEEVLRDEANSDTTPNHASTPMLANGGISEDTRFIKKAGCKLYVPDFSLRVDDRCVYLKLDRDLWRNGVVKSSYEIHNNELSDNIDYIPTEESANDLHDGPHTPSNTRVEFTLSSSNSMYKSHGVIKNLEQGSHQMKQSRRSTIASVFEKAQLASNARSSPMTPTSQNSRTILHNIPLHEMSSEHEANPNVRERTTSFTISQLDKNIQKDENSNLLPHKTSNHSVTIDLDERDDAAEKEPFLDKKNDYALN